VTVDLHSDLLADVVVRRLAGERDVMRRLHLPALRAAGVGVQVLAIFTPTALIGDGALRHALRHVDAALREENESGGELRLVADAAGLDAAIGDGAVAGILSLEGVEPLGREPSLLAPLRRLGLRLAGLTWNRANDFADGAVEDRGAGLTPLGMRLLDEMAALGIAVDLSHLTRRAAADCLERAPGAVLASHSNASALHRTVRNIDDDQLRAIGERGGVVGVNAQRAFLGSGAPATLAAAHARHIAAVAGDAVPAVGADLVAFLPDAFPEAPTLGLPADVDRSLQALPEAPRETFHLDLAGELGDRAPAVLEENALRFLRRLLAS
jgi:membrane dipeptidase